MKKYFIHNGTQQAGPFTKEELKAGNIQPNTHVWYAGISWTPAIQLDELKDLFTNATPPPFMQSVPPQFIQQTPPPLHQQQPHINVVYNTPPTKRRSGWSTFFIVLVILIIVIAVVGYLVYQNEESSRSIKFNL